MRFRCDSQCWPSGRSYVLTSVFSAVGCSRCSCGAQLKLFKNDFYPCFDFDASSCGIVSEQNSENEQFAQSFSSYSARTGSNRITGKKKLVIIDVLNASGDDVYAQNAVKDR